MQVNFFCTLAQMQLTTLTPSPAGAVGFPRSLGPMGRMWAHWFQPGIDCPLGWDSNVENFLYTRSKKMAKNGTFFQRLKIMRLRYHCQMVTNIPTTSPWVLGNVGNQPYHSGMLLASFVNNRQVASHAHPYKMYGVPAIKVKLSRFTDLWRLYFGRSKRITTTKGHSW